MDVDVSKLSPMGQLNMKNYSDGKPLYDQLIEMTKDPMKYNTELLMRIVRDNKDTEYGRKYGFAEIQSIEDYQSRVPITMFDDYAGYIYEMTEEGKTNLITAYPVNHYAKSSGTMGNPKRIPVSDPSLLILNKYNYLIRTVIQCDALGFGWIEPPVINLIEAPMSTLKNGATYGAISGKIVAALGDKLPLFMTSPVEALIPDVKTNARYLHARFALMNKSSSLAICSYISMILEMMQYIEKEWRMLVRDIEQGTIDESIKMPDEVRESLKAKIRPMPERAAELREIFEEGFDEPVMPKIWPDMASMVGISTGGFSDYLRRLKEMGVPMAIASSAPKVNMDWYIPYFNLTEFFPLERIIAGRRDIPSKPDGTIVRLAAESLGLSSSRTLIFEDSESGVKAALDAGCMKVIRIRGPKGKDLSIGGIEEIASFSELLDAGIQG